MKKDIKSKDDIDKYLEVVNACSTTDCTGLIPSGSPDPTSEESDSYNDIYQFEPQSIVDKKK